MCLTALSQLSQASIDISHACVIQAILVHTVRLRSARGTVTMLVLVLLPMCAAAIGAKWGRSVRLIVGVVAMVLVIPMAHVGVIVDSSSIPPPKNANTNA